MSLTRTFGAFVGLLGGDDEEPVAAQEARLAELLGGKGDWTGGGAVKQPSREEALEEADGPSGGPKVAKPHEDDDEDGPKTMTVTVVSEEPDASEPFSPADARFGVRMIDWASASAGSVLDGPEATEGDDDLSGTEGGDRIDGLGGDDAIDGGDGDDDLSGGRGDDDLRGGDGDDTLRGGRDDDDLRGGDGDDALEGGRGADALRGGEGDDDLDGGRGNDDLFGGAGDDSLDGGRGDDDLRGGGGDDTLLGERGADRLEGGAGRDVFVFEHGDGADAIVDFTLGEDVVDLSALNTGFAALSIAAAAGGAEIGYGGGVVLLETVSASDLDANDFVF